MTSISQRTVASSNNFLVEGASGVQVSEYLKLLRKWNSACSLVSRGDLQYLNERHVSDSVELLPFLEQSRSHLDIGSGGGFPGVLIAIARPKMRVLVNDRSRKKCRFLRHVKMQLELENVDVLELDIKQESELKERFDTVTMRAVGSASRVWELGSQFLNKSGAILMQTSNPVSETNLAGAKVRSVHKIFRGWISVVGQSIRST